MIVVTILALWLLLLGLHGLLLALWLSHFLLQLFVSFGVPLGYTALQKFLFGVFAVVTYPVRLAAPPGWPGESWLAGALLLAASATVWGVCLGTLVHAIRGGFRRSATSTDPSPG
jgi:hypothetical protein